MAIADRIKKPAPRPLHGTPCSVGALIEQLDASEAKALNKMLYELNWNATQVYDTLRDEGYTVGRQSINKHRGKKCRCAKDAA